MALTRKEERARIKAMLDDYIWEIFCTEGFDAVTYKRLADKLGTGKSSIQRFYPQSINFMDGLYGKVYPAMQKYLNYESRQAFLDSWLAALNHCDFRNAIKVSLNAALGGNPAWACSGFGQLRKDFVLRFPDEDPDSMLHEVMGATIIGIAEYERDKQQD